MTWSPQARAAAIAARRRKAHGRRPVPKKGRRGGYYGSGRQGRKAARIATYGRKRDGLSISQRQRRQQRANKVKNHLAKNKRTYARVGIAAVSVALSANDLHQARKRSGTSSKRKRKTRKANRAYDKAYAASVKRGGTHGSVKVKSTRLK